MNIYKFILLTNKYYKIILTTQEYKKRRIDANIIINLNNTNRTKKHYFMKRNTSFARQILSNCEGSPQLQKIELKRQKNNYSISQAIMDYNIRKARFKGSKNSSNNSKNMKMSYIVVNVTKNQMRCVCEFYSFFDCGLKMMDFFKGFYNDLEEKWK